MKVFFFLSQTSEITQQEVKGGGVVVVSDFERFEKIKDERMKESCVGGLWWVLEEKTDKCWREVTVSERCLVVGLDLVQLQILIPILPLRVSLPPLPPVFYERRISATPNKRNKATTEPAVQPGCGLR